MQNIPFEFPKGCTFNTLDEIKNKKITIMGLGLNGGGEACVRFFLKHGAYVTVTDMKTQEQLQKTIDSINADKDLDKTKLEYVLGQHRIEDFENADCVIKNPGVKIQGNKYLACAKAIESDMSIFLKFTKAPIIAITGSKGKSSTVSAINYGLNQAGFTCFLGGNITVSPLTFLDKTSENTPVVLELSSWQLADLRGRQLLKPKISIITKIVPDHQNWYGNMEDYVADKKLIYKDQTTSDYSIFDDDSDAEGTGPENGDTWGNQFSTESNATILRYSANHKLQNKFGVWQEKDENGQCIGKVLLPGMEQSETILKELSVPGEHMKINALNAALVMYLMKVPAEKIITILNSWQGIDHRLQYFHCWNINNSTVKFYNDSCATVPEACSAASQAFGKPVILIAGGTDKGLSFEPLIETLTKDKNAIPVKSLYLLEGTGTDKFLPALKAAKLDYNGTYPNLKTLLLDLQKEIETVTNDEIVVFSPGATSFGMFQNEFHRGNTFMETVKEIFQNNN